MNVKKNEVVWLALTDQELIEKILKGEGELFEELIRRYKNGVYSLCLRMLGNTEDAKDMAQETFIKCYHALGKYSREYKFSTWLFKIATNLCIDEHRKRKAKLMPLDEQLYMPYDTVSAETMYFHQTNRQEIERAIGELSQEYRILILLYHKEGLSYQQICDMLQLPMSKVKNRLHRARHMLKDRLKEIKEEESIWTAKELQI
ncbi:MAG: sigma-70 family RNA polymerase sigma factor [Geosporobacter ferrireducens]|nr:sigma-70 family RNA polymerase sigma factor [Geosporobacter ferrireducens]